MDVLQGLENQLQQAGVEVCYARTLRGSAVWVASHAILILNTATPPAVLMDACCELLEWLSTDPHPGLRLSA